MFALTFLLSALPFTAFFSGVSAVPGSVTSNTLLSRQIPSEIPSACTERCKVAVGLVNRICGGSSNLECMCADRVNNALYFCLSCFYCSGTDQTQVVDSYEAYHTGCRNNGTTLPKLDVTMDVTSGTRDSCPGPGSSGSSGSTGSSGSSGGESDSSSGGNGGSSGNGAVSPHVVNVGMAGAVAAAALALLL